MFLEKVKIAHRAVFLCNGPYADVDFVTLSQQGVGGGGGHNVSHIKNPVTLLRIHSSEFFLKACPKLSVLTQLWFPWKPWLAFKGGS